MREPVKSQLMVAPMAVSSIWHFAHLLTYISGLLVGACVNRATEGTFGAAVAEVGVLDLLKVSQAYLNERIPVTRLI